MHLLYVFLRVFPIKKNRIIFTSFSGARYGGNPRVISEYIKDPAIEKIWVLDKDVEVKLPQDVKRINNHSLKMIYYYVTAKVWVESHHFANRWKREHQYLIQTWHAALPLKKLEGDCPEYFLPWHIRNVYNCSKMTDYQLSNSNIATHLLRTGMWYYGPVLQMGMPINDMLVSVSEKEKKEIRKKLGLSENKKYVLYAPTCRKTDEEDLVNELQYEKITEILKRKFGNEWVFLYRGHPIADVNKKEKLNDSTVIDVTNVHMVSELLAISDVLISDYSSIITDFMVTNKPGFLFAYDYDLYQSRRDFNIPLEELPFSLAKNNYELINNIMIFDQEKYEEKLNAFMNKWNIKESGKSRETISNIIMHICEE